MPTEQQNIVNIRVFLRRKETLRIKLLQVTTSLRYRPAWIRFYICLGHTHYILRLTIPLLSWNQAWQEKKLTVQLFFWHKFALQVYTFLLKKTPKTSKIHQIFLRPIPFKSVQGVAGGGRGAGKKLKYWGGVWSADPPPTLK